MEWEILHLPCHKDRDFSCLAVDLVYISSGRLRDGFGKRSVGYRSRLEAIPKQTIINI